MDDDIRDREERPVKKEPSPREEQNPVRQKVKFVCFGSAIIEKKVKQSGKTGRVYLPPGWVGKYVKVIRIN